jgi:hypothetical protein
MKYNLIIFFLLLNTVAFSQSEWKCVYNDTLSTVIPDFAIKKFETDMREKNVPQEMIEAMIKKMSSAPVSTERTRYVTANDDSTFITLETAEKGALRNSAISSQYFLLKNKELYITNMSGKADSMITSPHKVFKATGKQPVYFNTTCREYISTDSTCTIWVAEQLPSCINPGVCTGDIKGAVLYYQLKMGENVSFHCGIATAGKRN